MHNHKKKYIKQARKLFLVRRPIITFGVILICLVFFILLSFSKLSDPKNVIRFTNNGFEPSLVSIQIDESVVFKNESSEDFWPASNTHPDHTIYSEFDPKKAVKPGGSWSFTFEKAGKWRFHDHLHPNFGGMITVLEEGQSEDDIVSFTSRSECEGKDISEKQKCYEDVIFETLEIEGVKSAFEILSEIINTDTQGIGDCHGIAHTIGKRAYQIFNTEQSVVISSKSSYCGYGFYHGFMEELLRTTGDIQEAKNFCKHAGDTLREITIDAEGACYHGIGHGLVEDVPPQELWGNAQAIIDRGLDLCELVASNDANKLFRCTSGVYNAYEILASGKKYNLEHSANPLAICDSQKEKYKNGCYTQLIVPMLGSSIEENIRTVKLIEKIENDTYAQNTLISMMVEFSHRGEVDVKPVADFCRSRQSRLYDACVRGYAEGFLKYGPPQNEYKETLEICGDSMWTGEEKKVCYEWVFSLLRIWYSKEQAEVICKSVPEEYWWKECKYF